MKTQHTLGPWKVVTSWGDFMVEGLNGEEIIFQDGPYGTPTIKLADANLIAATPELLACLQKSVASLEWAAVIIGDMPPKCEYLEGLREAKEAIAKATGGAA